MASFLLPLIAACRTTPERLSHHSYSQPILCSYIHHSTLVAGRGNPPPLAMPIKAHHRLPLHSFQTTPNSTPELSPASSSSDSYLDEEMDASSRPLSLAVPKGAFCPMRPSLEQVLTNTAPPPYTLSAFMAYLSQNHCLETLEFTLEANRYRDTFNAVAQRVGEYFADSSESQHVRMLWRRLLMAYILPGAPREINLSSDVRDNILRQADANTLPHPRVLDVAVRLTHELMEESIFMPFLNTHSSSVPELTPPSDDGVTVVSNSFEEHTEKRVRFSKSKRMTPPSSIKELGSPFSPSSHTSRANFYLSAMTGLGRSNHNKGSQASSQSNEFPLSDDSGSNSSTGEPITPPTTPPSSDPYAFLSQNPKNRTDNPWKKMGMKLGFKKRSNNGPSNYRDMKTFGLND